jgi:hypothetical protein
VQQYVINVLTYFRISVSELSNYRPLALVVCGKVLLRVCLCTCTGPKRSPDKVFVGKTDGKRTPGKGGVDGSTMLK